MFYDASDEVNELRKETKDLPDEIIEPDGTDDLPDEIGFADIIENEDLSRGQETNKDNAEHSEISLKNGGSYRDIKKMSDGETHEVHHMPADSASNIERDDGPAIKMEKEDHRQTASCGNSRDAKEYRQLQKDLIDQGRFKDALQMDIDDIRFKFGDKYDEAIEEMMDYVSQLEREGRI